MDYSQNHPPPLDLSKPSMNPNPYNNPYQQYQQPSFFNTPCYGNEPVRLSSAVPWWSICVFVFFAIMIAAYMKKIPLELMDDWKNAFIVASIAALFLYILPYTYRFLTCRQKQMMMQHNQSLYGMYQPYQLNKYY